MDDRTLLELAAKAAGLRFWAHYTQSNPALLVPNDVGDADEWNPLTDDGDALRLAVKLRFCLKFQDGATYAMQTGDRIGTADGALEICHRRAIVRAAATLGEAMP